MDKLSVKTGSKKDFLDITSKVKNLVNTNNWIDGVINLYVPHTTAGITINESADPDVRIDIQNKLKDLVPADGSYRHREGNSDAHIQSSIIGNSTRVFVEDGSLKLGTWQGIFFCEFDGPRSRNVWVKLSK